METLLISLAKDKSLCDESVGYEVPVLLPGLPNFRAFHPIRICRRYERGSMWYDALYADFRQANNSIPHQLFATPAKPPVRSNSSESPG
jgi:hypothetical protein